MFIIICSRMPGLLLSFDEGNTKYGLPVSTIALYTSSDLSDVNIILTENVPPDDNSNGSVMVIGTVSFNSSTCKLLSFVGIVLNVDNKSVSLADTEAAVYIIPTDDMEDKHALRSGRGGRFLLLCNNSISPFDAYVLCCRFTSCALGIMKNADTDDNNKVLTLYNNSK